MAGSFHSRRTSGKGGKTIWNPTLIGEMYGKNVQESWQEPRDVISESNDKILGIAVYVSTSGGRSKDSFHDSTTHFISLILGECLY